MAYENAVRHWVTSGGEHGMPPVPQSFDEDAFAIQVAKELGVPVTEVDNLPEHWLYSVRTLWAWQDLERKRASKRANHKKTSG